jgi:hypothetical protein
MLLQLTFHDFILLKLTKINCFKETKPLSNKQKSNFDTNKRKMDLNSKSIGLVLSGGGSKGIAHAGAIKFLEEQNIRPTRIVEQAQAQ